MVQAIRFEKTGGPEVLIWQQISVDKPGPGQVQLKHKAVGLNFIDTYQRSGLYAVPLPSGLGGEGCGIVEEVGPGVIDLKPGDRVAYAGGPLGAYCEERVFPADRLVPVPDGISDQEAAAMMLKGMTAWYLIRRTHVVKAGETILVHAAAGGVGLIACQWAKHLGATVIGTVGSEEKAALAKAHGCDHPILYRSEDFAARVNEITGGKKLPVVYDSVGKDTFFQVARLPGATRIDSVIRPVVGRGAAGRSRHPRGQGITLCHAADARQLHRDARGFARRGQ
jgi:NADPH:quinone reductase